MSRFHEQWDLLLTPTLPIAAFEAGREVPEGADDPRWPGWTPFTYPFNLTQQPAATVPCGFTAGGPAGRPADRRRPPRRRAGAAGGPLVRAGAPAAHGGAQPLTVNDRFNVALELLPA